MAEPFPRDMRERVHISEIRPGDTVDHLGRDSTVCPADLRRGPDGDLSLFGDSYRCGLLPVTRVTYGAEIYRRNTSRA